MTDRKKPTAGFWLTVALVAVLVGYPLGLGPAYWIETRLPLRSLIRDVLCVAYANPLTMWIGRRSEVFADAAGWYRRLLAPISEDDE